MLRPRSGSIPLFLALGAAAALAPPGCGGDVSETGAPATGTSGTSGSSGQGGSGGDAAATSTTATTSTASTTASTTAATTSAATTTAATTTTGAGGSSCVGTPGVVLAIDRLYLGETNPDDTPNVANGWKQYGFDIDGKVSTQMSMDLCQPSSGGSKNSVYPDGNVGIDNSFGRNILPIFLGLVPDASDQINQSIAAGELTMMLRMDGIAPGTDSGPFPGLVYGGASLGAPPAFDGTDCWPVLPEQLLVPGDIDTPEAQFPMSSVAANVWTSGSTSTVTVTIPLAGYPMKLVLAQARMTLQLDAAHESGTGGLIGGVMETEAFIDEIQKVAGSFDPSLCSGATFESLANQMRQASDIMKDGTQDPSQVCDGISIGLGFKMKRVQLGGVAAPVPPIDPCP